MLITFEHSKNVVDYSKCTFQIIVHLLIKLSEPMCVAMMFDVGLAMMWVRVSYASLTYFGDLLRCPHKRIVTITKVHRNKQLSYTWK